MTPYETYNIYSHSRTLTRLTPGTTYNQNFYWEYLITGPDQQNIASTFSISVSAIDSAGGSFTLSGNFIFRMDCDGGRNTQGVCITSITPIGDGLDDAEERYGWWVNVDLNGDGDTMESNEIYKVTSDPNNKWSDADNLDDYNEKYAFKIGDFSPNTYTTEWSSTDPKNEDTDRDGILDDIEVNKLKTKTGFYTISKAKGVEGGAGQKQCYGTDFPGCPQLPVMANRLYFHYNYFMLKTNRANYIYNISLDVGATLYNFQPGSSTQAIEYTITLKALLKLSSGNFDVIPLQTWNIAQSDFGNLNEKNFVYTYNTDITIVSQLGRKIDFRDFQRMMFWYVEITSPIIDQQYAT